MNLLLRFQVSYVKVLKFSSYSSILVFTFRLSFISWKVSYFCLTFKFIFTFVLFFGYGVIRGFIFVCLRILLVFSLTIFIVIRFVISFVGIRLLNISFFIFNGQVKFVFYHILRLITSIFAWILIKTHVLSDLTL